MAEQKEFRVALHDIGIRRKPSGQIGVIGNPNSGKSTLFNRLTGLKQSTGNFPGVTVEKHTGVVQLASSAVELVDLPGIYCLGGHSADERIAVDFLLGRVSGMEAPNCLLFVLDATHLYQGMFLLEQLRDLDIPIIVALTMTDMAKLNGIAIELSKLQKHLSQLSICPVLATTGEGMAELKLLLDKASELPDPSRPESWPELSAIAATISEQSEGNLHRIEAVQGLLHPHSEYAERLKNWLSAEDINKYSQQLFNGQVPQAVEARVRYRWVGQLMQEVVTSAPVISQYGARFRRWINRPWPATAGFFALMLLVFQAVFTWATPLMDAIDNLASSLGTGVVTVLGEGMVSSFLADGAIAGVGSVIIFLPQILILFLFIILLEDTGYLARAAFLMDRVMRSVGLSGQSVIPMLSSFACAVPAIMATRVIPNRRDRIATILAAPFMTCSARLPIYALLIAAFVPASSIGWFNLQGLVLFGLYLLGIAGGLVTALLLKSTALRGPKPSFVLALPEFRKPNLQTVAFKLLDRARVFLKRAGTVIFSVAVIVWFLAYFPRADYETRIISEQQTSGQNTAEIANTENSLAAEQLSQSWLGRMGRWVEPAFIPLGWDWRVSSAVIAGFPAREVVVAVMGTLYSVGSEADEASLSEKLRAAAWPDGRLIFTLPMVLGLLVFYAWCLQCAATVATIRRETNSWRWPIFAWCYMTALGYTGALLIFQIGSRI
ncbi:MAG: ferrous iron transport protein B [Xanthomonadales bacterium]|nr:ferrous iron transport protein B [Xanthomonadales bacterium]